MKILNLYFSSTGNTDKVASRITATVEKLGQGIDTVKVTGDQEIDLLSLGNITGRPHEADLLDLEERVTGVLWV